MYFVDYCWFTHKRILLSTFRTGFPTSLISQGDSDRELRVLCCEHHTLIHIGQHNDLPTVQFVFSFSLQLAFFSDFRLDTSLTASASITSFPGVRLHGMDEGYVCIGICTEEWLLCLSFT